MGMNAYSIVSLAKLLREWMDTLRWTESLFNLIRDFLIYYRPSEWGKTAFSDAADTASKLRDNLRQELETVASGDEENPCFAALSRRFGLSEHEVRLLRFFHLYLIFGPLEVFVDKLPEWEAILNIARFALVEVNIALEALYPSSRLAGSGLGSIDGHAFRLPTHGIAFGIPSAVIAYISTANANGFASFVLDIPPAPILPLSAHELPEATIAAARATLSTRAGKPTILLFGKPGTGKTEFAKSLSASCGYTACFLRHDRETGRRSFSDLLLAARLVDPALEVLVVDEADELLNIEAAFFGNDGAKDGVKKSMITNFLDGAEARMIFISNATNRIPDSILRRFTFHLGFEDFRVGQRAKVWNSLDSESELFSHQQRHFLSARYKANPSRIRQVMDICANLPSGNESEAGSGERLVIAEELLSRGNEIMYSIPRSHLKEMAGYDPTFLNLSIPVDEILASIDRWLGKYPARESGLAMLFFGPPGTGKTAFARHIAERIGHHPIVRKASDLLSPWVGETESRIRGAFREAEGTVLIFDEADSLLGSREGARASWERSMTNEVLTCMEDFKGLFIASTNFRRILDVASLRRFAYKLEFKSTIASRRRELLSAYFPEISLSESDLRMLNSLEALTPGDMAIAAQRLELATKVDFSEVVAVLREEISFREPRQERIGFETDI